MSARLEAAIAELAEALRAEIAPPPADAPDRLLSVDETSAALGISRTKVYALVTSGALVTLKVGRRRLVPSGSIAAFVAAGGAEP